MADTVLNTTVFDGAKRLITHYNVVSDSSGGTTKIVDVSGLSTNPATGAACSKVRLVKVSCNVSVTAPVDALRICLLYTSPSPRDGLLSRMPSSA